MPEFLELLPPPDAIDLLLQQLPAFPLSRASNEEIPTAEAVGRVTAEPIFATEPSPNFQRSTMDGYAVRAADTYGASESMPGYLEIIGEVVMGGAPIFKLKTGQCAVIQTGGMLPQGADAVVMVETTQKIAPDEVEISKAVAVGENVIKIGEDVAQGELVIEKGRCLNPAEIGGLMALGITRVEVVTQAKVAILSSGDEIVPPEQRIQPGQVRDINSFSLSALIEQAGGQPVRYGVVPDDADALRIKSLQALRDCDMLVITAGSSASVRDLTSQVVNTLGEPGVLVHGMNIRPGKPTILAICDGKPVIGLPGNPVSALVVARLVVLPVLRRLQGEPDNIFQASVKARLSLNIASQTGREDWIAVQLERSPEGFLAQPLFGKSNLIFTLARSDGLLRVEPDANGLNAGEIVDVYLW